MNQFDLQYKTLIWEIRNLGYCNKNDNPRGRYDSDGAPAYTYSLLSKQFRFDNTQVPLLTSKHVAAITAIKECPFWIWQKKSNVVQDLRDMGVKIWNQWELPDGTIGKAYGYQLGKKCRKIKVTPQFIDMVAKGEISDFLPVKDESDDMQYVWLDQVDHLLYELKHNRASRRLITELWNINDLDDMSLPPCVHLTQWYVHGNKLSLEVRARSNDLALGNPFNVFQYNILQRMIAQVCGYELGEYIFNMGDAHIYDRHIENLDSQMANPIVEPPKVWINPEITSFYDFKPSDIKIDSWYNRDNLPVYNFDVSV